MIEIVPLDTPSLGDRSYLATDGEVAVVVDPQRDVDRVLELAGSHGVRITTVAETHVHNDYLSGGLVLARRVGARYLVSAEDDVAFERTPVRDGDVVESGRIRLRVLHTPGHTFTHLSYALEDADDGVVGVFTGGSLLFGTTGRPDLFGDRHTVGLARRQYASAHRLVAELPAGTPLFPTHGFGSFCSVTPASGTSSTLGREAARNPVLTRDEETYVAELVAGLGAYPAYYAHMAPLNAAGPGPVDLTLPEPAEPEELRRRIDAGEWVVDLRQRRLFAAGHLPGTLNFGLDGTFLTHLGWLLPWGTPVTLLGRTAEDVATAQRELTRIGIDRPAAVAAGTPERWGPDQALASFPRVGFADLARVIEAGGAPAILDVRRAEERRAAVLEGSLHLPLHELPGRLDEVPAGRPVWVHCAVGYRAAIAASLLDRAGRDVVLVDDDLHRARQLGLLAGGIRTAA
ncbi:MBL fold metallo-hydrolase [Blastococcus deserti]|uniref:Rhodanese-like domain-containing protein n=1 Tax=Blastococcus deserti TaxID=2259033 RepID=A0ABW4X9N0_9ACTN